MAVARTLEEAAECGGDLPLSETDLVIGLMTIWSIYTTRFQGVLGYVAEIADEDIPMWHRARTVREIAELVMVGMSIEEVDVRSSVARCGAVWKAVSDAHAVRSDARSGAIAETWRREAEYLGAS